MRAQCEYDKPERAGKPALPLSRPYQAPARAVKELILHTWGVPCLGGVDLEADGRPIPAVASQRRCLTLTQWGTPLKYKMRSATAPPPSEPVAPASETGTGSRRARATGRGEQQQQQQQRRQQQRRPLSLDQPRGASAGGKQRAGGQSGAVSGSRGGAGSSLSSAIAKRKPPTANAGRKPRICLACDMYALLPLNVPHASLYYSLGPPTDTTALCAVWRRAPQGSQAAVHMRQEDPAVMLPGGAL